MPRSKQAIGLIAWIMLCLAVGGLGAFATTPEIGGWYQTIRKPSWNPPNWIFGPVWTTLYIMMAVAAWLVWRKAGFRHASKPLGLFLLQLILNFAWSFIFFRYHQPGWAFVEIVALWLAITATIVAFLRVSTPAALMLLPYLGWVSFASILNFTIWQLNAG